MKRLMLLLTSACVCAAAIPADYGRFIGKVVVEWLDQDRSGRKMKLVEDFGFQDVGGKVWLAPKGHIVEGASIPRVFRSLIGAPFGGAYREASVIHEYYCHMKNEPWKNVHRMFYDVSLAGGVDEAEAKIMYMAVYAEGLRWERKEGSRCYNSCHAAAASLTWRPVVSETDLRSVVDWIEQDNPGLEDIEERVNAVTKKPGPHLFAQGH